MPRRLLLRRALALDTQLTDRRVRGGSGRRVLLVGELGARLRDDLAERAVLTTVETLQDGFTELAERPFDVVVVNPHTKSCGLDFVNAIKEGEVEHQLTIATLYGARGTAAFLRDMRPPLREVLEAAREKHRTTPFVVLPSRDDGKYSIIVVPPHAAFTENVSTRPLVTTIMTVDAAKLLGTAQPMA